MRALFAIWVFLSVSLEAAQIAIATYIERDLSIATDDLKQAIWPGSGSEINKRRANDGREQNKTNQQNTSPLGPIESGERPVSQARLTGSSRKNQLA